MSKRFEVNKDDSDTPWLEATVFVDKKTGVQYVMVRGLSGGPSGVSVLVDRNGKPLLDPKYTKVF